MPLKKQVVTMPFAKGINEKYADGMVPLGELTQAENVSFDKAGEIIKRGGFRKEENGIAFSASSYGSTLSDADFGTSFRDTMLISGEKRLWARTSAGSTERYYDTGTLIPCEQTNEFLNRDGAYKHGPAKVGYVYNASTPAFAVVAYTQALADNPANYLIIAEVRDAVTNKLIHREQLDSYAVVTAADGLYDIPDPHVCVLGSKAFVLYWDTAGAIFYSGIALTTPVATGTTLSFSTPATMGFSIAGTKPIWDADVATSAGNATVASHTSGKNTAGCIVVAGLVANSSTGDGDIRVGYYTNASAAATVTLVAVTGSTGTTTYAGTSTTGGLDEAVPDKTTTSAVCGAVSITALNESTPANGQLLIASTYYDSGASVAEMEFRLLSDALVSEAHMAANTAGVMLRCTGWRESDSLIRVVVEYAKNPAAGGSKDTFAPSEHRCVSFEMNRSGNQTTLANLKTIGYNCSLFSDSFTHDSERYIAVSYTCGHRNSLSGNLFTLKAPPTGTTTEEWEPIAAGSTGEQPTSFVSDHQSGLESSLRFFGSLSRVTNVSGSKFSYGANRFTTLKHISSSAITDVTEAIHSVSLVTVDFAPDRPFKSVETPNGLLLTGGFLQHYDGNTLHENNFFNFPVFLGTPPKVIAPTGGPAGGWSGAFGDYRYRAVYEWYDEMGNLHRSAPSDSIKCTIAANTHIVALKVYVPQFTRKTTGRSDSDATGISVVIYRTEKDGSLYHRLASVGVDGTFATLTANYTDFGSDGDISDHEILYTEGGIPANAFVGSCKDLALHKERAFVVTSDNAVMHSKEMGARVGVNFTDFGFARVGSEKQTINAIESAGEAFVIFTDTDGFYISGEGPDATGIGGFTAPRRFAPGLGAIANADHMTSAGGAFINTDRGVVRVQPNLQLDYIGARAEDTFGTDPIHSMCLDEGANEARFFTTNIVENSTNTIVVYNTLYNQISVHKVPYSGAAEAASGKGAFYMLGDLYRVTADGHVHLYSPKTYTDNCTGSDVVYDMNITTSDINVAGLQNAQRAYRVSVLGDYKSAHTLSLFAYADYNSDAAVTSKYETFSQAVSSDTNPYNYRIHLKNQKCRAIRVSISIHGSAATGEAVILQGIALEVGVRTGTFKLPTAQTLAGS